MGLVDRKVYGDALQILTSVCASVLETLLLQLLSNFNANTKYDLYDMHG